MGLTNLGSESETCVGSRVHLVGVSISFEKNFYQLPFTPPSLVRRFGPSIISWQRNSHNNSTINQDMSAVHMEQHTCDPFRVSGPGPGPYPIR
jgi:hypothetical protein